MTPPGTAGAQERMRRGRITPSSRPFPVRMECANRFEVPDRLMRPGASPIARLLGVELCRLCRHGEPATAADNRQLAQALGCSPRATQRALCELEAKGFVWRLEGDDEIGLDSLLLAGFADPWKGLARPGRAIVLLWRLPDPHTLGRHARRARAGGPS